MHVVFTVKIAVDIMIQYGIQAAAYNGSIVYIAIIFPFISVIFDVDPLLLLLHLI